MTGIVDWAGRHARMVMALILLSLVAGTIAYTTLPKEGSPDIEIPAVFISVPFPGISAEDSERLLVKPMETELSSLDGLKTMSAVAREGYAGVSLEFEFGWNKSETLADIRAAMDDASARFPAGAEDYSINEINFSEFPILIVSLAGDVPERTLLRLAQDLQDRIEGMDAILEAGLAGKRDEMVEVVIDPLRLEAYDLTAAELIDVVTRNNRLIAAGEIRGEGGAFSVKIPSSFDNPRDLTDLPVKVNGDQVVTLGDLADIRLTFADRTGTARFDGQPAISLQVVKRRGFNIIDTAAEVREVVAKAEAEWPAPLRQAVRVEASLDQSQNVQDMVTQLQGAVLTAIALVMVVVLALLGTRSALLVGFAIPTSFLMSFWLLGVMDVAISNIVMFGLILAVGMLVDGAIVVVEYADRRIGEGVGPMHAFTDAAKRMFWPIISSTATTLCAFLPMLFWPGVAGEFMGMLPVTLIFVLSAALIVALIYLPVLGGVMGRISRLIERASGAVRGWPWLLRAALLVPVPFMMFAGLMQLLNPAYLSPALAAAPRWAAAIPGAALFAAGGMLGSLAIGALKAQRPAPVETGYRRTPFGRVIRAIVANPVMPLVTIAAVVGFVVTVGMLYARNGNGVTFFVDTEPEQAIVYVRARGNLSLEQKDALVRQVERIARADPAVDSVFAFAGAGGLSGGGGGGQGPVDAIGQIQFEFVPWASRDHDPALSGEATFARLEEKFADLPGVRTEITEQARGPSSSKPVQLRLKGDDMQSLVAATETVRARMDSTPGLMDVTDTTPLPGIDWKIEVDAEKAGRFGADTATVGAMVQLVTRGIFLDTMRVPSSDEEIDIRARLPEKDRVLSTLDSLKVRTRHGMVPLSNFITREPVPQLAEINRESGERFFDVKAAVRRGMTTEAGEPITPTERVETLTRWLENEAALPAGVSWEWTGDQEDQQESQQFLMKAFAGALGLMFIILLAQFNSLYNAVLVLMSVVLSTTGVLIGMMVMGQTFSIIMTGTGVVALAGIVVNNNIVLIDTYQRYRRYMPQIEAIIRTAEVRIRPVLLTTATTMVGLSSMMFGITIDFAGGGYTIDAPSALWWKSLASAVVFGLGVATMLTLLFTPAMLALPVWLRAGAYRGAAGIAARCLGRDSRMARDLALARAARRAGAPEIVWPDGAPPEPETAPSLPTPLRAAE